MLDDFKKDLEENKRSSSDRADYFKLKNGDNQIVILTNPIGYSEAYGIGIAYEGCGYAQHAGRRYKCYVLDMGDNNVKIANFSYTVAKDILALSEGERTKFEGFPMPYAINLKSDKAGTKEVEVNVLAMGDYKPTEDVLAQLESYSPVQEIIDRLKEYQKKKVSEDSEMQGKIKAFIEKKEKEKAERMANRNKDKNKGGGVSIPKGEDTIEYPEEDIDTEDIPF